MAQTHLTGRTSMARAIAALIVVVPSLILLLPVFVVAAVCLLFASSVRALSRVIEPAFVPWTDLIAFDPVLGWKPRPNLNTHYLADGDDVFRVVTDGEGW